MLGKLRDAIQDKLAGEPVECPRGWGSVTFPFSGGCIGPIVWITRTCPLSGAENCAGCGYQSNPDAWRLSENLQKLEELKQGGAITDAEFVERRQALMTLHPVSDRNRAFRIAAWVLGPLGILFTAAGVFVGSEIADAGWIAAALGAAMLALTLSFGVLGRRPAVAPDEFLADGSRARP